MNIYLLDIFLFVQTNFGIFLFVSLDVVCWYFPFHNIQNIRPVHLSPCNTTLLGRGPNDKTKIIIFVKKHKNSLRYKHLDTLMLLLTNEYLLRPVQKYFLHWSHHPTLIQSFLLKPNFYHKTFDVNEQCLFCKFGIK